MKLRLTWTKTGDYFDIVAANFELAEWYVDASRRQDNRLETNHYAEEPKSSTVEILTQSIKNNIDYVNVFFKKLKIQLLPTSLNLFDQNNINQIHKEWVYINQIHEKIDILFYKIDPKLFDTFHTINRQLHLLEQSFCYHFRGVNTWREPNPFSNQIFDIGVHNVTLLYCDHGRNAWEKFVVGELNPNDHELSQWKTIGSNVSIKLIKPYVQSFPTEFVEYCANHNIKPVSNQLPLGNLADISQLTQARMVMNNNLTQQDNYLIITHI
jgi:hypothetical protein